RPETLADHQLRPVNSQHRMKPGARRALHAMIGPQRLLSVQHGDALKRRRTRMAGGEGAVTWRMPILGQHHMVEAFRQPVDDGYNLITGADRKRATRAKIVLNVDDEQQFVAGPGLHLHLRRDWLANPVNTKQADRWQTHPAPRRRVARAASMQARKSFSSGDNKWDISCHPIYSETCPSEITPPSGSSARRTEHVRGTRHHR